MSKELNRLSYLHEVLYITSETEMLTVCERILINQERGYLLSKGSYNELRPYEIPLHLEEKIENIMDSIKEKEVESEIIE